MAEPERFEPFAAPLEDARRGRRAPEARRAWQGTLTQRAYAARGLPQAVLKITSHSRGGAAVRRRLRYISRDGDTPLELHDGTSIDKSEEIDQLAEHWAADFPQRKNSRDALNLVVSVPQGMDRDKALDAARAFLEETFNNHEYAFAGHNDTKNFHVHAVVKARGLDGKPMRIRRDDPQRWRQAFAAQARERGLKLDASPRIAHGQEQRVDAPMAICELRRRGIVPRRDAADVKEALKRLRSGSLEPSAYEAALVGEHRKERLIFGQKALEVAQGAGRLDDVDQHIRAVELASDLAYHAETMPPPKSRAASLIAQWRMEAPEPERIEDVRKLTRQVERALRKEVGAFEKANLQWRAIAARERLSDVLVEPAQSAPAERQRSPGRESDIER